MLQLFVCLLFAIVIATELPIIDLGYQRHQAIAYNATGKYYNFSNIRYAEPPVGNLRFAAPVPLRTRDNAIADGSQGKYCPQSLACWFDVQNAFVTANLSGKPFDFQASYAQRYANGSCLMPVPAAERNLQESEDCLFLDVFVPDTILEKTAASRSSEDGAPVLVYFQDGGFVGGFKSGQNPAGLIQSSRLDGSSGMIYVGFNYRLGSFGWMSGSKFKSSGGLTNAGLYDQRLALHWVQKYIHLVGGNPNRVTVMGESSGGSSIMTQMTAYGHRIPPPFQQVVVQSPAWEPGSKSAVVQNELFDRFLGLLNVSTLDEVRQLPSQALIDANHILVSSFPYGSSPFGPTIGGDFIPKDPKRLLLERKVDPRVKILSSYSSNEGVRLAPANITNDADFTQYAGLLLNSANTSVLQHVTDILYPPVFNDSMPYTTQQTRADLFWTELVSICNPRYLHQAVKGPGYAIEYSVVPALHLADTPSIFWNGPGSDPTVNETVAELMQGYITKFVTTGNPNSKGKPVIDVYDGKHVLDMGDVRVGVARDVTDNPRCEYWHSAPYAS